MKETPMLFNAAMVRAYFAGRKTKTRRIIDVSHVKHHINAIYKDDEGVWGAANIVYDDYSGGNEVFDFTKVRKPPAEPGDVIWGKETWRASSIYNNRRPLGIPKGAFIQYEASGTKGFNFGNFPPGRIRQSIFMRQWMARIVTPCLSLRVERLQDISEEDAKAEGCTLYNEGRPAFPLCNAPFDEPPEKCVHRASFYKVWQELNEKRAPWGLNPWVWVISFKPFSPAGEYDSKETKTDTVHVRMDEGNNTGLRKTARAQGRK
jgi:hypothetical protein